MFACTELITGYDDFGKIIFLQTQSDCRSVDHPVDVEGGYCPYCHARTRLCEPAVSVPSCGKARRGVEKLLARFVDRTGHRPPPLPN